MARQNGGKPKEDIREVGTEGGTERGQAGGNTDGGKNGNSSTSPTNGGSSAGATPTSGEQTQKVVEVPILNLPTPKTPTKKKSSSKEPALDKSLESNVSMLLQTGFEFASTRLGEHWKVSEEETKAISEPMTRILQRLGVNETANKYMDYFALLAGVGMVIVPRVLITQSMPKEVQNGGAVTKQPNKKGKTKNISQPVNGASQQVNTNVGSLKANLAIMDY